MTAHELHQNAFDIPGLREVPADDGDRPPDAQPMAQRLPRRKAVIDEFRRRPLISPDCSLYRDAPLAVQIANTYKHL